MKYEFHVGDYIETKDGWIGYATIVDQYWSEICNCWGIYIVGNVQKNNKESKFKIDIAQSDIWRHFNRIGRYDFAKTINKIKPLLKKYNDTYSKINELAEAVNRLDEKVNEMAQSLGLSG